MPRKNYISITLILALLLLALTSCGKKTSEPDVQTVAAPTFNPPGGAYTEAQSVSISSATSGATILYTTDGNDPTYNSEVYSSPINISSDAIVKAKAFKSGWTDSSIASTAYTIRSVATPVFDPPGGEYLTARNVTISSVTEGATIRFTTDGSDPDSSSTVYGAPININSSTTVKAKAFKSGWADSSIASAAYTIGIMFPVAKPTFNPVGGSYANVQNVLITCATEGATIRYTTDGYDPTINSTVYDGPVNISSTTMLKAQAFKFGWIDSSIASASYTIGAPQLVALPAFDPVGGHYPSAQNVSIICATPGATICYTTDGNNPTNTSPVYSGPINISVATTVKAKAFKYGWTASNIASASYTFGGTQVVATPFFDPVGGHYSSAQNVSIACATRGATIRYTSNGNDPTSLSPVYSNPIPVNSTTTIKAMAFKAGWTPSSISGASYIFGSIPGQMVYIPGGSFIMGDTRGVGEDEELPTHNVILNSFYMGVCEVTQAEYQTIMGSNPALGHGVGDDYPVYNVNWYSAIKYCNLRSMDEGFTPVYTILGSTNPADWGTVPDYAYNETWNAAIYDMSANGYRLPTEAEWEYAARGASNYPDYLYSGSDESYAVAWDNTISEGCSHPVGDRSPNALGLYDMSGNVFEWCWDWYSTQYYSNSPSSNPTGANSGTDRVMRGGSWFHNSYCSRVAYRYFGYRIHNFSGFRVCRSGL